MGLSSSGLSNGTGLSANSSSLIIKSPNSGLAYGGGGAAPIVWSAISKSARVTLTNGGLAANSDANDVLENGRTDSVISAGMKAYWEVKYTAGGGNNNCAGFANASWTFTDGTQIGADTNSIAWYCVGIIFFNGGVLTGMPVIPVGSVTRWALNFSLGKFWAALDGGGWLNDIPANQDPVTGVGGLALSVAGNLMAGYMMENLSGTFPATMTAAFNSGFAFSIPSGYTAYGR